MNPSTIRIYKKDLTQHESQWLNYAALDHAKYIKAYQKTGRIITNKKNKLIEQKHKSENFYRVPKEYIRRTPFMLNTNKIDHNCQHFLKVASDFENREMIYCTNPVVIKKVGVGGAMLFGCKCDCWKSRGECALIKGGDNHEKKVRSSVRRSYLQ